MHVFLKNIKERAQHFRGINIVNIPKGDETKHLIDQYGLLDLKDIKAHALTNKNESGRDAQNASQMYNFLYSSLSEEAKLMVMSNFLDYAITTTDRTQVSNGPCFLKVITSNTSVNTRSTVFHIQENLNHLEAKILELSYNIEAFNLCVTSQVDQPAAGRETSSDLLINVFEAYIAVPDKKFIEYVEKQNDKFDKGEEVTKKLMQVALIKCKDRKRSDKWQAPLVEEEQILSLTA